MPHDISAAGRWLTLSLAQQMGNIGSEVSRSLHWEMKGNREQALRAFDRGLELFDLTLADDKHSVVRKREIARARDEFSALFFDQRDPSQQVGLQNYFDAFARIARSE